MSDFVAGLTQALKTHRFVVLGDPHHGSASFASIVEAVAYEANGKQSALIAALQSTEILLENLSVGQPSSHGDVNADIASLATHGITVTGCETPQTLAAENPLREAEAQKDRSKILQYAMKRVTDANAAWEGQATSSAKPHVIVCCGTAHVPACRRGTAIVDIGLGARLARHGSCAAYAVVFKEDEGDLTYIPEKEPKPEDDMFGPVTILEPFEADPDDGSSSDET